MIRQQPQQSAFGRMPTLGLISEIGLLPELREPSTRRRMRELQSDTQDTGRISGLAAPAALR